VTRRQRLVVVMGGAHLHARPIHPYLKAVEFARLVVRRGLELKLIPVLRIGDGAGNLSGHVVGVKHETSAMECDHLQTEIARFAVVRLLNVARVVPVSLLSGKRLRRAERIQ